MTVRVLLWAWASILMPTLAHAAPVDARLYDTFFLWAAVKPQPALKEAKSLYLLQAQVEDADPVRLVAQRPALPQISGPEIWMVVRVETLDWPESVYTQVLSALDRWRAAGNDVVGLQIDFDAATRQLDRYASFLAALKTRLPPDCRLSVTGLLDWSGGDVAALGRVVDEIVLQTYQGRHIIPNYAAYMAAVARLQIPFRIGLLQGSDFEAPDDLADNRWFRGYVVFLVNPD